jgi:plasmid rolling circle replication initiator protein Rep
MPIRDELGKLYPSLTKHSPSDSKFESHKIIAQEVARLYGLDDGFVGFIAGKKVISFESYSVRISVCGSWLTFVLTADGKLKLVDAKFCKVPNCPMCQWRRSLKWRAKFLALLPQIQEKYPTHRWVFLTLTVRNCELEDLRTTLSHLTKAFNRLSQLKRFPMDGLVKSVEVTRAWDCYDSGEFVGRHGTKWVVKWEYDNKRQLKLEPTTEVHPHLHICGLVRASYFSTGYISHDEWVEMWQKSLRVDYQPIVNVKAVKPKKGVKLLPEPEEFADNPDADKSGIVKAICETLKYTVKEQDLVGAYCTDEAANAAWLKGITQQLYKTRKVEYRGVLKEIGKELDKAFNDDDLIRVNDDKDSPEDSNLQQITFRWIKGINQYIQIVKQPEEIDF